MVDYAGGSPASHRPDLAGRHNNPPSDASLFSSASPDPSDHDGVSWRGSDPSGADRPAQDECSTPTASVPSGGCAVSQPFPRPLAVPPPPPNPSAAYTFTPTTIALSNQDEDLQLLRAASLPDPSQTGLLDTVFAGNAVPVHPLDLSLPSPPPPPVVSSSSSSSSGRSNPHLRLPPFEDLGIAAPHPDRIELRRGDSLFHLGSGPLSKPEDPLHALSPVLSRPHQLLEVEPATMPSPPQLEPHVEQHIPALTPPEEPCIFHWGPLLNVRPAGMASPPTSEPGQPMADTATAATAAGTESQPPASASEGAAAEGAAADPAAGSMPPPLEPEVEITGVGDWRRDVESIITEKLSAVSPDGVKVLSHALPCPSRTGHIFPIIIDAIHRLPPHHSTAWINVFHAVPGRFTLADLPTSPPTTPGPVVEGEEYFTSKVFDSAVAVSDYQSESKLLPPSPRPVVPPGSVDVSIVERYIPPTNVHEFAQMFAVKGRSLLVDRLIELSANDGTLLLIYPTRTGSKTFMKEYLGPILDPLLRGLAVVNQLPTGLCTQLGTMESVDRMVEYDALSSEIERLCTQMSNSNIGKLQNEKCKYSVIYSSREEVKLDRQVWATDWWIKQEKSRIRSTVTKYTRPAQSSAAGDSVATPTHLIQEILDGVTKKTDDDAGPQKGVEVGVFVIRKSS